MIAGLKPYPNYREARKATDLPELGIPWLAKIPEHWEMTRSKRLFTVRKEKARPDDEQLSATQAFGVIRQQDFEERVGRKVVRINLHLDDRAHVEKNDFVISMRSFQGGLERAWEQGCIRSSYVVLRPSARIHVGLFSYLFKSHDYIRALQATSNFIRDGQDLNFSNFMLVDLPAIPFEEQKAMARFLNWASGRIQKTIRRKQRLIALLNEQKQAIIHRAVTRGLDPGVRLKPSGIDWLPDIPANWSSSRVKHEFDSLNTRRIPLSGTERGKMTRREFDYYGASGAIDKVDDFLFDDDLLLIAEDGANLVLRNLPLAIIARGKFWVNNHAHILKPRAGNLEFLAMLMERIDYRPWISGAAQPKLTQDRLMAIRIPIPPREVQDSIVQCVGVETDGLNQTIENAKSEVNFLREYRTRLIADVVTGKLDVRGVELAEVEDDDAMVAAADIDTEEDGAELDDAVVSEVEA